MRSAYISLAAASLCWAGALALGFRHGSGLHGGMTADQGHRGRIVMTEMDIGSNEHRQQNKTGNSGKDHGHAYHHLDTRQAGGQCGAQYGKCPGDLCCSDYGYCGDSVDHCAPLFDCQPQYGTCGWPRAPPAPSTTSTTSASPPPTTTSTSTTPTTTSTTSTTSAPTPPTTTSTTSAPLPPTTSATSTSRTPSTTSQAPPTQTVTVPGGGITINGQCGNGTMCIGNPNYGPCCSQFFWCGSALDFCGAGCRSEFGACLGVPGQPGIPAGNVTSITSSTTRSTTSTTSVPPPPTTTSTTSTTSAPPPPTTTSTTSTTSSRTTTSAAPTPTVVIPPGLRSSTDGSCGPGITCLGSSYGRCCSQFGYCGDSDQFCPYIVGCQPEYGYCDARP